MEVGLDAATLQARDQLTCSREDGFVSDQKTSRLISRFSATAAKLFLSGSQSVKAVNKTALYSTSQRSYHTLAWPCLPRLSDPVHPHRHRRYATMPLEILRRPSGLFFFWLVASLSFPELVSAQTTYEGTLLEHKIERRYRKFSRCPIANRRSPRGFESDVVGGIGNFMITDIPSAFSCEIMRFSGGEAEVTMATENIMVQLDDPTILPGIVTLLNTQTVSTRISLNGSGRFTQGGDDHSARIGVAIGLEEAVDRIELRKVRPDGCADDRDYTTSTTRARDPAV